MIAVKSPVVGPQGDSDSEIADRIRLITVRLNDGFDRIEAGRLVGRDVSKWESVWLDLLREYEELYDRSVA